MATVAERIELLHNNLAHVEAMGGEKKVEKQHAKGKLTARERLALLFDEGSFVEVNALVKSRCYNFGQEKKDLPGEGVVTGYGTVDGRLVFAFAQDFTVEGGSLGEMHAAKIVHVNELALKVGAPCVGLNDSGGARIQEAVDALSGYGKIFWCNTIASGVIPQISAIMDAPIVETGDDPTRTDASLDTIMPENSNAPYDMYDVIKSIVDNGEYYDVAKEWAKNIITCFCRMDGQTVGIIANQPNFMAGCLDYNASDKAARFIRFCDCFNIPVLNIVDVPGFLPGKQQEYAGVIRHGAKMLFAYCEATVPKITLILRKAYGGSYIAMCSREQGADQVFAWPTAEIAVMGPAGAANIIFKKDPQKEQRTQEYVDEFATPYKAAERGYVDAVIDPRNSRPVVINALKMLASKHEVHPAKKHGNIPL